MPIADHLTMHADRLTAHASRLIAHASRLTAHASRLTAPAVRLALVATLLLVATRPALAQGLQLVVGGQHSGFPLMQRPTALEFRGSVPIPRIPFLALTAGFSVSWAQGTLPKGTTCNYYNYPFLPPNMAGCANEPIFYESRLTQWDLGLRLDWQVVKSFEVRGGLLLVRNGLHSSSHGLYTRRPTNTFYPERAPLTAAYFGEVVYRPLPDKHFGLLGRFDWERLDFAACNANMESPFCATEGLSTLEAGLDVTL